MRLDNAVSEIEALLKNSSELSDAKIITAFPDAIKPTRLDKALVAIGISELDIAPSELESSNRAGNLSIFADIFVPSSLGSTAPLNTLVSVCKALDAYCIVSIKADKPYYSREVQAVVLKTVITFSDRITFGGDDNE
ncbi:MAG: hypothetical protein J1E81_03635 [Eubacterium sp.]|nr:hypothetical protein [Eubacterium sp.]